MWFERNYWHARNTDFWNFLSKRREMKKPHFNSKNVNGSLTTSYYSLQLYFFYQDPTNWSSRWGKVDLKGGLLLFYSSCKYKHFKVSICKLTRIANVHKQIADSSHTHSPPARSAVLAKTPTTLLNFCILLRCLKCSCLNVSALPLSQETAFLTAASEGNV